MLRYDDRGVGASTGVFKLATPDDFIADALAAVDRLRTHPAIDTTRIGLIGHSQGGIYAPRMAVLRPDIAFIVMMAGPGIPDCDLIPLQVDKIIRAGGCPDSIAVIITGQFKSMFDIIRTSPDSASADRGVMVSPSTRAMRGAGGGSLAVSCVVGHPWVMTSCLAI